MSDPNPDPATGLLFSADLMWISRVTGTAQALNLLIKPARTLEQLEELAQQLAPRCVIFDLELAKEIIAEATKRVREASAGSPSSPRLVAFGSHVDVASLQAARDAGCDPVLPRSKMADQLPELLKQWLG